MEPTTKLELSFESGEKSLWVRRFAVHETMSGLFSVSVWARSEQHDLDLDTFVGRSAGFTVTTDAPYATAGGVRRWVGVCERMEQIDVEKTGASTYYVHIAPALWLLTQHTDNRLFQHMSIPSIVEKLAAEWQLRVRWAIDREDYPKLELRTQYGETDFVFVSRLLEEAGIAYTFADNPERGTLLVFTDKPQAAEARGGGSLLFVDNATLNPDREFVRDVEIAREVRPGKVTLRDHDFRRRPDYQLLGATPPLKPESIEDSLELYGYRPGLSLVETDGQVVEPATSAPPRPISPLNPGPPGPDDEPTPGVVAGLKSAASGADGDGGGDGMTGKIAATVAASKGPSGPTKLAGDDQGMARHDEKVAKRRAKRELDSARTGRREIKFVTNALDLAPGVIFSIEHHPRADLSDDRRLLVVETTLEGELDHGWHMTGHAVHADQPYRPALKTQRPIVHGLQSAVVVGPKGEEIYTDEFGRVRVQFHWDLDHEYHEDSSCWLRVAHGWAGPGYGIVAIPRVSHEVLVAFLEGNPDLPVVVGSLHNGTAPVPHALPGNKTRSMWKTSTSPGGGGSNELMFEDAKGKELVYVHAQRDLQENVRHDRAATIGQVDSVRAGKRYEAYIMGSKTHIEMVKKKITLTTGDASIVLDGPEILIWAKSKITIQSASNEVLIQGGPMVRINPGVQAAPPKPKDLPPEPKKEQAPRRLPVLGNKCVHLGVNKVYKESILRAAERTGVPPEHIAAVIFAEAGKQPNGLWKADSHNNNPRSDAEGLTQFIPCTWLDQATTPGTYLYEKALALGYVEPVPKGQKAVVPAAKGSRDVGGPRTCGGLKSKSVQIVDGKATALLDLRSDPDLAIVAGAEYDKSVLETLQKHGDVPTGLDDLDTAKALYMGHHEGQGGVEQIKRGTLKDKRARALLSANTSNPAALIAAAGGDAVKAYEDWLTGYINENIRPDRYRCTDEKVDGDDSNATAPEVQLAQERAEQRRQQRAQQAQRRQQQQRPGPQQRPPQQGPQQGPPQGPPGPQQGPPQGPPGPQQGPQQGPPGPQQGPPGPRGQGGRGR